MKEELLHAIKAETGLDMRHNQDFITLADLIFKKTRENISPTTLKRVWGYICDQKCRTSGTTLNLLSRFLGFESFYDFNRNGGGKKRKDIAKTDIPSDIFSHGVCLTDDLEEGEEIIVTWMPDRTCRFRYLGNKRFSVVESVNAQISAGDTFTCHHFINGETLSMVQLTHKGKCGLTYVAGKLGGIHFKRVLSRQDIEKEGKQ